MTLLKISIVIFAIFVGWKWRDYQQMDKDIETFRIRAKIELEQADKAAQHSKLLEDRIASLTSANRQNDSKWEKELAKPSYITSGPDVSTIQLLNSERGFQ